MWYYNYKMRFLKEDYAIAIEEAIGYLDEALCE